MTVTSSLILKPEVGDSPIRVLLVEDHQAMLWGLEKLIETAKPRMEVIGTARSCLEALEVVRKARPDVVVLDIDPTEGRAIDAIPQLIEQSKAKLLLLSGLRNPAAHDGAVLAGARGIVSKHEPAETIIKAIEKIHEGEVWLDRATTGRIFERLSRPDSGLSDGPEGKKIALLTPREREVIAQLVADASASYKNIAGAMQISEHTLRNHLSSIYRKLGVVNRLQLFLYAQKYLLHTRTNQ